MKWIPAVAIILSCNFARLAPAAESKPTNGLLDKQHLLDRQTLWDNKDWDWYKANIPFLETPDPELDATYYYRFDMMTKHFVYGSPETGYTVTEFIDRPGWSGTYGAISCALGLQLSDLRWLRDQRVARDYSRYWFHTPGAQPRAYSNWFGASMWSLYEAWGDREFILKMRPDMKEQYLGWERDYFKPPAGLFSWNGMQDGMETNINSRQTNDSFRGAEGYRPTLNSYLYADALAISHAAALAGDEATAQTYRDKAAALKDAVQKKLWDAKRQFFFHRFARDEKDGVKADSFTYQTGAHAGDAHGRELIGFIPWQFDLPDSGYEAAWKALMDPECFFAPFGPTTTERHDPLFLLTRDCCVWSGNSWPYATSQTLEAMANLLNNYKQDVITREDYAKLLQVYSRTQRLAGKPFIAEAANPDTGAWQIVAGHSEHYFHSSFPNLVVTGLAGLRPRADDTLEVNPLLPASWAYFALDDIAYHGHLVSILWDHDGTHYGKGAGLSLVVDGKTVATARAIGKLEAKLPTAIAAPVTDRPVNFAVNNDGTYFPNLRASFSSPQTPIQLLNDGASWYGSDPPNRWTTQGSTHASDWLELNFGAARPVESIKLYFLDDGDTIVPPARYDVDYWDGKAWQPVADAKREPLAPQGRRPNTITFAKPLTAEKFRFTFVHQPNRCTGLTEVEAWGHADLPLPPPTAAIDDLAYNPGDKPFPKASASFTSPFDKVEEINDGKVFFSTNSRNRWTAYQSPHETDWVQIDLEKPKSVGRVDLYLWADNGGVRAPRSFRIDSWNGTSWVEAKPLSVTPPTPRASMVNSVQITPVTTSRIRVTFEHASPGRTGLTEMMLWEKW